MSDEKKEESAKEKLAKKTSEILKGIRSTRALRLAVANSGIAIEKLIAENNTLKGRLTKLEKKAPAKEKESKKD